jgi:cell division protein FtsL
MIKRIFEKIIDAAAYCLLVVVTVTILTIIITCSICHVYDKQIELQKVKQKIK